jgi:3-hydroxyisobutyrate dehydrogenase-like beta-hydroxyacid dehydrogenase
MNILNVGFIGLGEMGKPMAKNLLNRGFTVLTCSHIRKNAVIEIEQLGGRIVDSPESVAKDSDVIITMARDMQQTDEIISGKGSWHERGIWQGIKTGSTIIICSTLSPIYCQKLALAGKELGICILDAPVSGGYPLAERGDLTFIVGGDRKAFEKCQPIFKAMGKSLYYLGRSGSGQALKLINNYMMIVNAFGTSEAITVGLKYGLDLKQMLEIIKTSSGNSSVIQNWDMLTKHQRESEKSENFVNSIFYKDVVLANNFADEMGAKVDLGNLILKLDGSRLFPS